MTKYLKFTKDNAKDAIKFIGQKCWFYSRLDLFQAETFNPIYTDTLISVDVHSDEPFAISSRSLPYLVVEVSE